MFFFVMSLIGLQSSSGRPLHVHHSSSTDIFSSPRSSTSPHIRPVSASLVLCLSFSLLWYVNLSCSASPSPAPPFSASLSSVSSSRTTHKSISTLLRAGAHGSSLHSFPTRSTSSSPPRLSPLTNRRQCGRHLLHGHLRTSGRRHLSFTSDSLEETGLRRDSFRDDQLRRNGIPCTRKETVEETTRRKEEPTHFLSHSVCKWSDYLLLSFLSPSCAGLVSGTTACVPASLHRRWKPCTVAKPVRRFSGGTIPRCHSRVKGTEGKARKGLSFMRDFDLHDQVTRKEYLRFSFRISSMFDRLHFVSHTSSLSRRKGGFLVDVETFSPSPLSGLSSTAYRESSHDETHEFSLLKASANRAPRDAKEKAGRVPRSEGHRGQKEKGSSEGICWLEDDNETPESPYKDKRVLTGFQPSGFLHLGNLLAALLPIRELQARARAQVTCLIGDLHATFGRRHRDRIEINAKSSFGSRTLPNSTGPEIVLGSSDEVEVGLERSLCCGGKTTRRDTFLKAPSNSRDGGCLHGNILDAIAMILATGVEPALIDGDEDKNKTVFAVQSLVPEHTMVATLLMGTTPLAWLDRCTAATANIRRAEKGTLGPGLDGRGTRTEGTPQHSPRERPDVGMRFYPLLMAADILAQRAEFVLVGDDQRQHLEFTRQAARRWNNVFGSPSCGPPPASVQSAFSGSAATLSRGPACSEIQASEDLLRLPRLLGAKRICARLGDLEFPERKMSKSSVEWSERNSLITTAGKGSGREGRGCLFLTDTPDAIAEKIAKAKTDTIQGLTYTDRASRANDRPACQNLLHIWSAVTGETPHAAACRFASASWETFKKDLTAQVIDFLSPIQSRFREIRPDLTYLGQVIRQGARAARQQACSTVKHMQDAMGFVMLHQLASDVERRQQV